MSDQLMLTMANTILADYASGATPAWQNLEGTCHVFHSVIAVDGQPFNLISFEGTIDLREWIIDDFNPLEVPDDFGGHMGPVHQASLNNVRGVLPAIRAKINALGNPPFYLSGHSKGAREAAIAAALLKASGMAPLATRLFECPRPGGIQLTEYLSGSDVLGTRTWNTSGSDIITLVPFGPGWADPSPIETLKVPDGLGIVGKHKIQGVLAGLSGLG